MSRFVRPQDLETAEPFSTLFDIDPSDLANIVASMKREGYHTTKPIRVWEDAFGTPGRRVVWEGHTRLQAAKEARIKEVPIAPRRFKSLREAYEAAVREQRDRRNLTRDQMAVYVLRSMRELKNAGGNLTRKQLANLLGAGEASIGRATGLLKEGNEDLVEQVLAGRLSLLDAYTQSVERGRQPAGTDEAVAEAFAGPATKERKRRRPRQRGVRQEPSTEQAVALDAFTHRLRELGDHQTEEALVYLAWSIFRLSQTQNDVGTDVQLALDLVRTKVTERLWDALGFTEEDDWFGEAAEWMASHRVEDLDFDLMIEAAEEEA